MLGCIWVTLGVFMFIITFANLSFFELSEKFGCLSERCLAIFDVLRPFARVTLKHVLQMVLCVSMGFPSHSASYPKYFQILFLTYIFFYTSLGRLARAPAHEAMSPLRSLAVCESWEAPPLQSMRAGSLTLTGSGTVLSSPGKFGTFARFHIVC